MNKQMYGKHQITFSIVTGNKKLQSVHILVMLKYLCNMHMNLTVTQVCFIVFTSSSEESTCRNFTRCHLNMNHLPLKIFVWTVIYISCLDMWHWSLH